MKNFIIVIIATILLYFCFDFFLPDKNEYKNISTLAYFAIFIFPLYLYRYLKHQDMNGRSFFGLIFFSTMTVIMIIGNLNYYVVKYIFPFYIIDMNQLNFYWIMGIILFSEGYFSLKIKSEFPKYVFMINSKISLLLLVISLISSLLIIFSIGSIPILSGKKGLEVDLMGGSLLVRLWSLNLLAAISFLLLYFKSYNRFFLIPIVISILLSAMFNQRMVPFAIVCSIFLIVFLYLKNRRNLYISFIISILLYSAMNFYFLKNRSNIQDTEKDLSLIQNTVIRFTFNEYQQLGTLIESDIKMRQGMTFLAIPLSFIPAFVLSPFGIVKSEYMNDNSATILAKYKESPYSIGLRTGIMGELYVNFGFFGVAFMFILGRILSYLRNFYVSTYMYDIRRGLIVAILVLLLYSLIGQINAVASQIANYLIILYAIIYLWKRHHLSPFYKIKIK